MTSSMEMQVMTALIRAVIGRVKRLFFLIYKNYHGKNETICDKFANVHLINQLMIL